MELSKSFEPHEIERRWYPLWESRGYFRANTGVGAHHGMGAHTGGGQAPAYCSSCPRPTSPARCTWGTRSSRR